MNPYDVVSAVDPGDPVAGVDDEGNGYFDGSVDIGGDLEVTGSLTVGGSTITPGSSIAVPATAFVVSGDVTLANVGATWTQVPGLSWTIAAAAGDTVELDLGFLAILAGTNFLDQVVVVAGAIAHCASNGTATPAVEGDPSMYRQAGAEEIRGAAPFRFVVQAGWISGGLVTVGLWYKGTGTTSTVFASANYPFRRNLTNYGQ